MKIKFTKDRRTGERMLVKTGKGEALEYAQAETLKKTACAQLLPFNYERDRHGASLVYDMTDTVPLETLLSAKLSLSQFKGILQHVVDAFEVCERLSLDPTHLDFEMKHVRLTADDDRMTFAYFPLSGLQDDRETVKDLLGIIARRAQFVCAEDRAAADALLDHLERQTVFSVVEFKEFLDSKYFGQQAVVGAVRKSSSRESVGSNHVVDLVQIQAGVVSLREKRQSQTLAQRVVSEVAESEVSSPVDSPKIDAQSAPSASLDSDFSVDSCPLTQTVSDALTSDEVSNNSSGTMLLSEYDDCAPTHVAGPVTRRPGCFIVRLSDNSRFFVADGAEALMGRSKDCAFRITGNPGLSRKHAVVTGKQDGCLITDLGSTNGTFVNDERLAPNQALFLAYGSTFRLAQERFRVDAMGEGI